MKRRDFIGLFGAAVTVRPVTLLAQQEAKIWRIGFLTPRSHPSLPGRDAFSDAFMQGMNELGYHKTAAALGLAIPLDLAVSADRVIE